MKIAQQEVTLVDSMGSDLSVVNAARVSFAKESEWLKGNWVDADENNPGYWDNEKKRLKEADAKLIRYLATHNHWSPFAHAFLSFRIKAPIFVARQLVKHQVGLSWNEVSRRYVDDEPEFYMPTVWRGKPINAKQGSDGVVELDYDFHTEATYCALNAYTSLLQRGVAPEQARMVLPQNTMTEWVWSGSLMAFARICKQRLDPHAQRETQEVAQLINQQIPQEFAYSWKALLE